MSHTCSANICKHQIRGVQVQGWLLIMGVEVPWPVFNFASTIALLCRLVCHRSDTTCFHCRYQPFYLEIPWASPWKGWRRPLMKFNWWVVSLLKTFWNSLFIIFQFNIFHYYKIDSVFETTNAKCESGNWHHPPYHGHKVNPRIHSHSTVPMRRRGETTPSVAGWTSWPQLAGWRHCSNSNRWATSDSQDLTSASYRLMLMKLGMVLNKSGMIGLSVLCSSSEKITSPNNSCIVDKRSIQQNKVLFSTFFDQIIARQRCSSLQRLRATPWALRMQWPCILVGTQFHRLRAVTNYGNCWERLGITARRDQPLTSLFNVPTCSNYFRQSGTYMCKTLVFCAGRSSNSWCPSERH